MAMPGLRQILARSNWVSRCRITDRARLINSPILARIGVGSTATQSRGRLSTCAPQELRGATRVHDSRRQARPRGDRDWWATISDTIRVFHTFQSIFVMQPVTKILADICGDPSRA